MPNIKREVVENFAQGLAVFEFLTRGSMMSLPEPRWDYYMLTSYLIFFSLHSASLRLAYQETQEVAKSKAQAPQNMSQRRAEQFERLGMGVGGARAK